MMGWTYGDPRSLFVDYAEGEFSVFFLKDDLRYDGLHEKSRKQSVKNQNKTTWIY